MCSGVKSCLILCDPMNFPGKNTGVDCHFLFQWILPTQVSNPCLLCLLHWQADSLPLNLYKCIPIYKLCVIIMENSLFKSNYKLIMINLFTIFSPPKVTTKSYTDISWASLMAQMVRICLQCRRPGFDPWVWKIPLEKEMDTHSSILAWRIPWTEEPGGLVHGVAKSQKRLRD